MRSTRPLPQYSERAKVQPLPLFHDRRAVVTSDHWIRNPRRENHQGIDFFYARRPSDPGWAVGDGGGTSNYKWIVPPGTPVLATLEGTVKRAGRIGSGLRVWIAHTEVHSCYFHLERLFVRTGQRVRPGDLLGFVGDNPADHDARHLHFEVRVGERPTDPKPFLRHAQHLRLNWRPFPPKGSRLVETRKGKYWELPDDERRWPASYFAAPSANA